MAHHDVHGIVAHFLRDRDEFDAVLGELADVELHLEMIAEEAKNGPRSRRRGRAYLSRPRSSSGIQDAGRWWPRPQALHRSRPVRTRVGGNTPRPACGRDRNIMLGLPRRGDAQVESGAQGDVGIRSVHGDNLITWDRRHGTERQPSRRKFPIQIGKILARLPGPSSVFCYHRNPGPNSSSNRSPNHASNMSNSRAVTGMRSGQSSVTVQVERSCLGGRPIRLRGMCK